MEVGGQGHAPAALPPGKTRYPLHRRLGGPQDRCGRVRKISPTPGFDPRTVQPITSGLSYPGPMGNRVLEQMLSRTVDKKTWTRGTGKLATELKTSSFVFLWGYIKSRVYRIGRSETR